jgi:hypothetical protein
LFKPLVAGLTANDEIPKSKVLGPAHNLTSRMNVETEFAVEMRQLTVRVEAAKAGSAP